TGIAGQAVAVIAHATPRAAAAWSRPEGRAISASVRNSKAMTGGSVMPTASGNAITGEAAKRTVDSVVLRRQPTQRRCGAATVNAAQISAIDTAVSHSRGAAKTPEAPSAPGRPNTAPTGRGRGWGGPEGTQ